MNELTVDKAARNALEEIRKRISELNKINIAVVGKTGSGKSTLINSVFGKEFAKAAVGEPVTTEFCRYTTPESPLPYTIPPDLICQRTVPQRCARDSSAL